MVQAFPKLKKYFLYCIIFINRYIYLKTNKETYKMKNDKNYMLLLRKDIYAILDGDIKFGSYNFPDGL